MEKEAKRIGDLPVEAEQAEDVKGGMRKSGELKSADSRLDPYKN